MKILDKMLLLLGLQRVKKEVNPILFKQMNCEHHYLLTSIIDQDGFILEPNTKVGFINSCSKARACCVECNKDSLVSYGEWINISNAQKNKEQYKKEQQDKFDQQFEALKGAE